MSPIHTMTTNLSPETTSPSTSDFSESKIVNAQGDLLTVYHGTKGVFSEFKVPAWFTPTSSMADFFSTAPDDDGNERTSEEGEVEYIVFHAHQVRILNEFDKGLNNNQSLETSVIGQDPCQVKKNDAEKARCFVDDSIALKLKKHRP